MTTTGEHRTRYATAHTATDPRPSRFADPAAYQEWAARADAWTPSTRYTAARRVVDTRTAGTLEGALLDLFTASALVAVYDALSPKNRAQFDALPLDRLLSFVWQQVKA